MLNMCDVKITFNCSCTAASVHSPMINQTFHKKNIAYIGTNLCSRQHNTSSIYLLNTGIGIECVSLKISMNVNDKEYHL